MVTDRLNCNDIVYNKLDNKKGTNIADEQRLQIKDKDCFIQRKRKTAAVIFQEMSTLHDKGR
jgi:hypothetical protein